MHGFAQLHVDCAGCLTQLKPTSTRPCMLSTSNGPAFGFLQLYHMRGGPAAGMLHSPKGRHSRLMTLPVRYPGAALWTIAVLSLLCCLLGTQLLLTQRRCPPSGSARPLQASDDRGYLTVYVPAHGSRPLSQLLSFRDDTLSPILAQVNSAGGGIQTRLLLCWHAAPVLRFSIYGIGC